MVMSDQNNMQAPADPVSNRRHAGDPMRIERNQPDPMPQMSTDTVGATGIALLAFALIVILSVVFYGLNGGTAGGPVSSTASNAPAAGANSGAPKG